MKTENEIIDALGGTGEVARLCQITTGAVSQWREKGIPKSWMMFFRQRNPELFETELTDKAT